MFVVLQPASQHHQRRRRLGGGGGGGVQLADADGELVEYGATGGGGGACFFIDFCTNSDNELIDDVDEPL